MAQTLKDIFKKDASTVTLQEHLQNAAKLRWYYASEEEKKEHGKMMNAKRWAGHRKVGRKKAKSKKSDTKSN